ncbi:Hypothetical predicted protein [Octopus vulgaris]|uniref:Uncharacterized protein n=1 Tax=Octopus vulgaris TaxID=6645 RepID=A0AA36BAE4_OCTVU|nr:Hypothetical predicted protein [Octopus vulgaris]
MYNRHHLIIPGHQRQCEFEAELKPHDILPRSLTIPPIDPRRIKSKCIKPDDILILPRVIKGQTRTNEYRSD